MKTPTLRFQLSLLMFAVAFSFAASAATSAADGITYTRFLLPIYTAPQPGAYGSLWEVDTWMRYSGSEVARIAPRPFCYSTDCTVEVFIEPGWPSVPFKFLPGYSASAVLVHVQSEFANDVTFNSRIHDVARNGESAGTEVPVVREDGMSPRALYLLNVPMDARFRVMLRAYALPEIAHPEVEVRYYRQPDPSGTGLDTSIIPLRTERVALRTPPSTNDLQLQPSLVEIGNLQGFPELMGEDKIWIEVRPLTPELRIWAFVSITNNVTQEVTIIAPHPI